MVYYSFYYYFWCCFTKHHMLNIIPITLNHIVLKVIVFEEDYRAQKLLSLSRFFLRLSSNFLKFGYHEFTL